MFGVPDFIHRHNDVRLVGGGEVDEDDVIIFANGSETKFHKFAFNDSEVF